VGGTTTDIAVLHDGRPRLNPEGAQVSEWRTMVEAVDVHTVGLGGDSQVYLNSEGRLVIGPRRVVPLCLLASEHPGVVDQLQRQVGTRQRESLAGQFVLVQRRTTHALSDRDQDLMRHLAAGPQPVSSLVEKLHYSALVRQQIESLEARGLVLRAGFTPTDALHVLARFERWDAEASRLGAELLAAQTDLSAEAFCERVVADVSNRVTKELISKVLSDEANLPDWEREPSAMALLARALGNVRDSDLDCQLRLRQAVVAVGAPVEAYLPRVARQLRTELVIPRHAEVGNAVGAVAGGVVQQLRVIIRPLNADQHFRLHLPDGVRDFSTVEEAVAYAQKVIAVQIKALAQQAGAEQIEVQMTRVDQNVSVTAGWEQQVYLGTELTFTAVGRPSSARRE
jgi:N-methylhydantoinase A/oxoprolinase/acetone carboxylase beta subunit